MESSWMENYIRQEMTMHGGRFYYYDRKQKKMLSLHLKGPVDPSRIVKSGEDQYAACVTLYSDTGEAYDLDFILKTGGESPQVKGIATHSLAGIPRYRWQVDRSGFWKQLPY